MFELEYYIKSYINEALLDMIEQLRTLELQWANRLPTNETKKQIARASLILANVVSEAADEIEAYKEKHNG